MRDDARTGHAGGRTAGHAGGTTPDALTDALREVLRTCDADRLARHLGLRSAASADRLRANRAALSHLTTRLAEGCEGLDPQEAAASARALLGEARTEGSHG